MGLDVDWVGIKQSLEDIKEIAAHIPHGEREAICDDIMKFNEHLRVKYVSKEKLNDC